MATFDGITYSKGQALIRMLENYLGESAFRDCIRDYMADHAYGNTTTADLWQAIERAARKPVTAIAASFTEQDGVPLVIAETSCNGATQRMGLQQQRFVIARAGERRIKGRRRIVQGFVPDATPRDRTWQIPIAVGPVGATRPADILLLGGPTMLVAGSCGEAIKVNLGDVGYYRVVYGPRAEPP